MPIADQDRAASVEVFTRTADNSALYSALAEAVEISDIGEKAGYDSGPDYRLIRIDRRLDVTSDREFEIALIDDLELSVAYYAKVTLLPSLDANSRPVARHQFWRSANMRHSPMLRDISQKLLFSYIVRNYDLLIMEDSASNEGKFYWLRQVSRAIELGLHVYVSDLITQALKPLSTQRALMDMQNQTWSGTDPHSLRALISIYPLDINKHAL